MRRTSLVRDPARGSEAVTRPTFWGWRMVTVAGLGVFLAGPAQSSGVSVFIDPMREEFGWSHSLVSATYALANLLSALAVVLSGRLLDRWGHRAILVGTAFGFGAALLAMAAVRGPLTLAVGFTLLRGLGIGALLLTCRTLPSQWYVRRRGRALSLVALGGSLSLALVPVANELLIDRLGWQETWRLNGLVVWLLLVPAAALIVRNRPEEVGQFPDGGPAPE
nr:MFS transporter [Chloroflexota bacterium]